MRISPLGAVLAPLLLAGGAFAQLVTTTLPYLDGDTVVLTVSTNPAGIPATQTVRTVTAITTGLVPTTTVPGAVIPTLTSSSSSRSTLLPVVPTTTALTSARTSSTTSLSTSSRTSAAVVPGAATSATTPRVGQDTALPPPMRTTTYYYDTGNGYWTVATWTASVTAAPTIATVIVPKGTVQEYPNYQTSVNSNVLASAQASESRNAGQARAAVGGQDGLLGWAIMGVGAVVGAAIAL